MTLRRVSQSHGLRSLWCMSALTSVRSLTLTPFAPRHVDVPKSQNLDLFSPVVQDLLQLGKMPHLHTLTLTRLNLSDPRARKYVARMIGFSSSSINLRVLRLENADLGLVTGIESSVLAPIAAVYGSTLESIEMMGCSVTRTPTTEHVMHSSLIQIMFDLFPRLEVVKVQHFTTFWELYYVMSRKQRLFVDELLVYKRDGMHFARDELS